MQRNIKDKVPKYLFGVFCFYLLYFSGMVICLGGGLGWILVSVAGIIAGLLVLWFIMKRYQAMLEEKQRDIDAAARARENFLANMSHEVRTPMNAVMGMVELALRNGALTGQDKKYLCDIRTAAEDLAAVIDDITDVAKIDSGSFEVRAQEYGITSVVHDVVNVIQVMLGEKQVVLSVDVNPDVPARLRGDGDRVKQVMRNLLGNAVRYTENGTIHLSVESVPVEGDSNCIDLKVSVADTGSGMSDVQLNDLFTKFKNEDGSRNYAKGGSGLGLAISKRVAKLMPGTLEAKSEPGKGSEFIFTVRQEVVDAKPCIYQELETDSQLYFEKEDNQADGAKGMKEGRQTTFRAPDARILLVDDNKVNLKVAEGLLRPYKMCIETADSGRQAIEMVQNRIYDLIFMDHMMPEMDGVEVAKAIRELDGEYFHRVPVIALSANAVQGAKELFTAAGMNDFVAKPIEMRVMDKTLRKWLPAEKIVPSEGASAEQEQPEGASDRKTNPLLWQMEGVDVVVGMKYSGEDVELYREILTDYMDTIEEKAGIIEKAVTEGDLERYTIEVHSLKSTSRSIGAIGLSEFAKDLEANGKNEEWGPIIARTPALLSMYRGMYHTIMPYRALREWELQEKKPIDNKKMSDLLGELLDSLNMYDSIRGEEIISELSEYDIEDEWGGYYHAVDEAMGRFDYDACKETAKEWRNELK